jgi:hypothetical protein
MEGGGEVRRTWEEDGSIAGQAKRDPQLRRLINERRREYLKLYYERERWARRGFVVREGA